jgi:hypothetical protein
MFVTYRFENFRIREEKDEHCVLENDLNSVREYPPYIKVITVEG